MNRLLARLSIIVAVFLVIASIVSPVVAQSKSVEMPRRDAEITILPNGDVQIVETWEVKFSGGPFTSAFRSIPLNKVDSIDAWSVADGEHQYRQVDKGSSKDPYTFEYTIGDGQMKATWFYPAITDQTRTFKVGYTLHGALRIDPAGDQFYWKFIEADRQYPIAASHIILHLPEGFKAAQLKAVTYRNGAEQDGAHVVDDRTIEYKGESFPSGTEWEIRAQFPHDVVKANPAAWQKAGAQPTQALQPSSNRSASADVITPMFDLFLGGTAGILALIVTVVAAIGVGYWLRRSSASPVVGWQKPLYSLAIFSPIIVYVALGLLLSGFSLVVAIIVYILGPVFVNAISGRRGGLGGSVGSGGDWGRGGDWGGGSDGGGSSDGGGGGSSGFN